MAASSEETGNELDLEGFLLASKAVQELDVLERSGQVPADRAAAARSAYQQLQRGALQAITDLAALQQRMSQLLVRVQQVQVQQEMVQHGCEPLQMLDRLREDRELARQEAATAADSEDATQRTADVLQQRLALLSAKLADAEEERRAELAPDIQAATEELGALRSQLHGERARAEAAQREAADIAWRLEAVQLEVEGLRAALAEEQEDLRSAEQGPGRERQAADLAVAALRQAREEEAEVVAQLRAVDAAELAVLQECKELSQQQLAAARAADRLRFKVGVREREVEERERDVELAKVETEKLMAEQIAWDLEVEKRKADAKREGDAVKAEQRGSELLQRRLDRAEGDVKRASEELPRLRMAVHNCKADLASAQRAQRRESAAARQLQQELAQLLDTVAGEKQLTQVQSALVQAGMAAAAHLQGECAALRDAAAERDAAIRALGSQRDAAVRVLNQQRQRLAEAIDCAEAKDGEAEELGKRRAEARTAHRDLNDLCGAMSAQMVRFHGALAAAARSAGELRDRAAAAEAELAELQAAADGRAGAVRTEQRAAGRAAADRAALAAQLAAARRAAAAATEAAGAAAVGRQLAARGAQEGREACTRLHAGVAAAVAAKQAARRALLERSEEMCGLFEQSAALQRELDAGVAALRGCDGDMRALQLQAAELQRRLDATQRAAPDDVSHDRQLARLRAEVLRARREAESLGDALESPEGCADRVRLLPGKLPAPEDLAARAARIEERLAARKDLAAQKDLMLSELEALTEGLLQQARASHHPALDLSLRTSDARRAAQQLTRRMMAAVSELSLYQALSLKCAADRDALTAQLAAAHANLAAGRPPTAGADQEFERLERDRAAEAEVRAQAAELRQLRAAGLLGGARSAASPRPQAYIPEDSGVPKPFPAAFKPFKPGEPPAAVALQQQRAATAAARSPGACGAASPSSGSRPATASAGAPLAGVSVA